MELDASSGPSIERTERGYRLLQTQLIPQPRATVWDFFSSAENLERLTPPFLGFQILTPCPIAMGEGTLIEYSLRLFGVPLHWRTEIQEFAPPERFVDFQLEGPYALWEHTHTFEERSGGTWMTDEVNYRPPLGPLGSLAHSVFIGRTLRRIFRFRQEVVEGLLGEADR